MTKKKNKKKRTAKERGYEEEPPPWLFEEFGEECDAACQALMEEELGYYYERGAEELEHLAYIISEYGDLEED